MQNSFTFVSTFVKETIKSLHLSLIIWEETLSLSTITGIKDNFILSTFVNIGRKREPYLRGIQHGQILKVEKKVLDLERNKHLFQVLWFLYFKSIDMEGLDERDYCYHDSCGRVSSVLGLTQWLKISEHLVRWENITWTNQRRSELLMGKCHSDYGKILARKALWLAKANLSD